MAYLREIFNVVLADIQLLKVEAEREVSETRDFIDTTSEIRAYYYINNMYQWTSRLIQKLLCCQTAIMQFQKPTYSGARRDMIVLRTSDGFMVVIWRVFKCR